MLEDILIPLFAVGLAEIGDKTQLSLLLLSAKTKKHLQLLSGALLAFLIVDGIAILFCSYIANLLPIKLLKIFSGIVFIILGVLILRENEGKAESKSFFKNSFISGFVLIFMTEWGDKTQIASGLFVTKYNALMVLTGTMIALTLLSLMAIYSGKFISKKIDKKVTAKIAGIVFILTGISFLLI
ncbi:MAG: TMEM165/GDT1 family protein [Thermodesulfovibrionales bacterium]|nr:TMEM165/GDT1 family protein [Thermodesulfovibrionales bacterium]